jgi:hypothetical protein
MWHGGTGQAWREEITTYYSIEATSMLMAQLNRIAARVADGLSVEHIDLVPILDDSLKTYYDFIHLTPAGAGKVAAAVAGALLRQLPVTERMRAEAASARDRPQHAAIFNSLNPAAAARTPRYS